MHCALCFALIIRDTNSAAPLARRQVTGLGLQAYQWGGGAAGLGRLSAVCRLGGRDKELYLVT